MGREEDRKEAGKRTGRRVGKRTGRRSGRRAGKRESSDRSSARGPTPQVLQWHSGEITCSGCKHSNYCIGRMYTLEMRCHHCVENMPASLRKEIEKAEAES